MGGARRSAVSQGRRMHLSRTACQVAERNTHACHGSVAVLNGDGSSASNVSTKWSARPTNGPAHGNESTYASNRFNPESGLFFVNARYYDPALGTWTARDPAGYIDGMSLYPYVQSNPTTCTDPTGLCEVPANEPSQSIPIAGLKAGANCTNPAGVIDVMPNPQNMIGADVRWGYEGLNVNAVVEITIKSGMMSLDLSQGKVPTHAVVKKVLFRSKTVDEPLPPATEFSGNSVTINSEFRDPKSGRLVKLPPNKAVVIMRYDDKDCTIKGYVGTISAVIKLYDSKYSAVHVSFSLTNIKFDAKGLVIETGKGTVDPISATAAAGDPTATQIVGQQVWRQHGYTIEKNMLGNRVKMTGDLVMAVTGLCVPEKPPTMEDLARSSRPVGATSGPE